MPRAFIWGALCAAAMTASAQAERIYVPVLDTTGPDGNARPTRIWAQSEDGVSRQVSIQLATREGLEPARTVDVPRLGRVLDDVTGGNAGLVAIDAEPETVVRAFMVSAEAGRATMLDEVPIFFQHELYDAGVDVPLGDLPRRPDSLLVGAANVTRQTASCQATLSNRHGDVVARIPFAVEAMSVTREDAAAWTNVRHVTDATVTCDRIFYPLAVATESTGPRQVVATGTGPNGTCKQTLTLTQQTNGTYTLATPPGLFHQARPSDPKGIVCIRTPTELRAAKAVYEWDVAINGWSPRQKSGVHNMGYFFLERFRSGTIGNVNALGPNKSKVKFNQNVGLPACGSGKTCNTKAEAGYLLENNVVYHVVYTFDAQNKRATMQIYRAGALVKELSANVSPGNGQALVFRPYGKAAQAGLAAVAEFGNYLRQHKPEEASLPCLSGSSCVGWIYSNFKLTVYPKQ